MSDEPVQPVAEPAPEADEPQLDPSSEEDRDRGDRRSLWGLLALIAVIVIIVLVFLMLRGCGGNESKGSTDGGGKEIVSVTGLLAVPGSVSVWVAQDTPIDGVLSVAGVADAPVTNMGGGRFVVTVPLGSEDAIVDKLKKVEGVYDSGRVYTRR